MERQPQTRYTIWEYLAMQETQEQRAEFYDGEIFAMAGGSDAHNAIGINLVVALQTRLRDKGCKVRAFDMMVVHHDSDFTAYPDVVVTCAPVQHLVPGKTNTLTNPQIIIEILSESTAEYDRRGNFKRYRLFHTLQQYILVHQNRRKVEVYERDENGMFDFPDHITSGHVTIVGHTIPLDEIYQGVELPVEGA